MDGGDGLISLLKHDKEDPLLKYKPEALSEEGKSSYLPYRPRMVICVTVYNESRDQLEKTLDGLI